MERVNSRQSASTDSDQAGALPWTAPQLVRMRAGDAEVGANPTRPEGPIAIGS